jgi:hypothetical protein
MNCHHRRGTTRPLLEVLEDRLPPGDWFLGAILGPPLFGPALFPADHNPWGLEAALAKEHPVSRRELQSLESAAWEADDSTQALLMATLRSQHEPDGFQGKDALRVTGSVVSAGDADDFRIESASTLFGVDPLFPLAGRATGRTVAYDSKHAEIPARLESYPTIQAGTSVNGGVPPAPLAPNAASEGLTVADPVVAPTLQPSGETVHALFDLRTPAAGPFPSNWFTVPDPTHNTGRRVNLPFPDRTVFVSDGEDIAVLNELDGFNLQPRLSVPFSGPIDVSSVTRSTVFLIRLGDTLAPQDPGGQVVGINQVVWDVETNTLHAESDALLAQHTRFALIVTNGVRDADGDRVEASQEFRGFRQTVPEPYRRELLDALGEAQRLGVGENDIVTASVFTTQSTTAVLEKIRDQIKAQTPAPADFFLGPNGERTVFDLDGVTGIRWDRQVRADPPGFTTVQLNLSLLRDLVPGAVGQVAFGKYLSPEYLVHPGETIPQVGTRTGMPAVQAMNEVYFTLVLPAGPKPAGGWPIAIFGQGGPGPTQYGNHFTVAGSAAQHGLATITITLAGSGFGPLSTLTVNPFQNEVTFPGGGRSRDQNGDNLIGGDEGSFAARPRWLVFVRDTERQIVADLMQLVRVIQVGVDVDGDALRDLDPARAYYVGTSFGGFYGTQFLAVEPDVPAGVLNVGGGSVIDDVRHYRVRGSLFGASLRARVPPLLNSPGVVAVEGVPVNAPYFFENLPLRDGVPLRVRLEGGVDRVVQAPVVNTVPGARALQEVFEHVEWTALSGDPLGFAPYLGERRLAGVPAKSVLFQFAKGDQDVPNPSTTALLRASGLRDRATYYRHDLAYADNPLLPKNPHGFAGGLTNPNWRPIALGAHEQIAVFLASHGQMILHPEPRRYFEVPIQGPLPEDLGYIP